MFPIKQSIAQVALACAFLTTPVVADTFVENNGVLILEAESSPAAGEWVLENSIGGYAGSGYLRWSGPDYFSKSDAGNGTITYRFRIQNAGNYEMLWRSRITRGDNHTEHNDSWIRFPTGQNISGQHGLDGWTKVFMSTLNNWVWQSATVDNVGMRVRQYFSAGEHTVQISGRSNGHAIDRIALFQYEDGSVTAASLDSMAASGTTTGTSPIIPSVTEPTIPDPVTAPPVTANTEAPVVTVVGELLSWQAVDAVSINVHRGSGEWVESLPGSQTQWTAPSEGTYYVVAAGEGSWESWGRSDTVTVSATTTSTDPASPSSSLQLTAEVYSATALELFWVSTDESSVSFEVRRDDELLTISGARSYFEQDLQQGRQYNYSVTALDNSGNVVGVETMNITTQEQSAGETPSVETGANLSAKAYSQSAIELFWNSASADSYQVHLDGELLANTDGSSFFRESLSADTAYEFFVTSLDSNGNAIAVESVIVKTFAQDAP